MNWRRAPLFLALATVCAALLLVFAELLFSREKSPVALAPATPVSLGKTVVEFPPEFGRLSDLVSSAGGVAPVPTDVTPVEHSSEFRDATWVNSQNPEVFTIQILAARDEEVVKRFLAGRNDRTQYVYFLYPQDGNNWYVVTTGSFATRELAAGVAGSKDFGLPTLPFPRRMETYQSALKAAGTASAATTPSP